MAAKCSVRRFTWMLISFFSFALVCIGVTSAKTVSSGPGNNGWPYQPSDFVVEYVGCGLCGLANPPAGNSGIPTYPVGSGAGGTILVPQRYSYSPTYTNAPTSATMNYYAVYDDFVQVRISVTADKVTDLVTNVTASVVKGGTVYATYSVSPSGVISTNILNTGRPYALYFSNGFIIDVKMLYFDPNKLIGGAQTNLWQPV